MPVYQSFAEANQKYAANYGDKADLPLPPGKKLTIVACMDARLTPETHLGLKEGDAHIIRNAGGSTQDALRSIIVSQQLLGTREIAVFHHTDCGMLTFENADLKASLKDKYPSATGEIDSIDFLPIQNLDKSVVEDVNYLKKHPLILDESTITGWVYDVKTGKIKQIV